MTAGGAAKAKTPIEVTEKMALNYVREAITNFHPKAGPMKQLANEVKLKGNTLIWGDEKFTIEVAVG